MPITNAHGEDYLDWSVPGIAVSIVGILIISGCGEFDDRATQSQETPEEIRQLLESNLEDELQSYCTVRVEENGVVTELDMEEEYLPSVVACENGNAPMEALKAQAVAARSHALYEMGRIELGIRRDDETQDGLSPTQDDQVYGCEFDDRHYEAVQATRGEVVTYNGKITAGFYVAGDPTVGDPAECPGELPSGVQRTQRGIDTEPLVTYNKGKSGPQSQATSLGSAANPRNQGAKSQNGASCLDAVGGYNYRDILFFYYGDDIRIEVPGANECVQGSSDGLEPPSDPEEEDSGGGSSGGASCQFSSGSNQPSAQETCSRADEPPTINPRASWNPADRDRVPPPIGDPQMITVHHTVTQNNYNTSDAQQIRGVQNYHINDEGYADIGYHYVIGWDGDIYEARRPTTQGAHVRYHNPNNLGIALLGNFEDHGVGPTDAQLDSVTRLIRHLADKHDIDINGQNINGHQDFPEHTSNACPGTHFASQLGAIIEDAGHDVRCEAQEDESSSQGGYRYVRVHGVSKSPTTDDDVVEGFEVDAIYGEQGGNVIEANSVACSPGVVNASAALGPPDNDSCDNRAERVAGVAEGGDLVVELEQPLEPGDTLNVAQYSYQSAMSSCEPTGTAEISVSSDGSNWRVVGENVQDNWVRTLDAQMVDDAPEAEPVGDEEGGFDWLEPQAGGAYTPDLTFRSRATDPDIETVEYFVPEQAAAVLDEDWVIGSSSDAGTDFEVTYDFQEKGDRVVAARALDSQGQVVEEKEITILVTDEQGVIEAGESESTPSPLEEMDEQMAQTIAAEGGRCYSQYDNQAQGDRCQDGEGGWSSNQGWHFVKRALERAGIDWRRLESEGPCSWDDFHGSSFGFRCNADANPGVLKEMGLRKVDVPTTEAPAGAIIGWGKGCQGHSSAHGSIQISMGDGTGCSDSCTTIAEDASCASVYIPVP